MKKKTKKTKEKKKRLRINVCIMASNKSMGLVYVTRINFD